MKIHFMNKALHTLCIVLLLFINQQAFGTDKTIITSGNWSDPATWGANGSPSATDKVILSSGQTLTIDVPFTIEEITISQGATLTWSNSSSLTINSRITVEGSVNMNGGNINLPTSGSQFILSGTASFIWDPGDNTVSGATLFTNGNEIFSITSTLIIKKWYTYTVPLGSVITGDFGNLTLNSINSSNLIQEWNQNNQFQSHKINGTLTIDKGWITLDKSGSISSTTIGALVLNSVNSSFYGHNGTHSGSFSLNIGTVTNNGGNFYGISDGNGNVTVNVSGSFSNAGNVKIINNTGISGVGNGNANFTVGGLFSQSSGDTRVIYNVSTNSSGVFSATFHSIQLTGGIFMAQTGCNSSGAEATFTVLNNFTVSFINTSDKFRLSSLTSIGASLNKIKIKATINGNLSLSGTASSEFTTSASTNAENITVKGNMLVYSGNLNFNYGTSACAHQSTISILGNLEISGGNSYFSRNSGVLTLSVGNNFILSSGNVYIKGDAGLSDFQVNNFSQTGGNLIFHNNTVTSTNDIISFIVTGSFSQTGGILNFDNNVNAGARHQLKINSSTFTIGGTGLITRAGAGTSSIFGLITFTRGGNISYTRSSNTHQVQQTKYNIQNATTLDVISGNIILSGGVAGTDYFTISSGGAVNLRNSQFVSGAPGSSSGIQVDSAATLKTYKTLGLYDGTTNAAISSTGNMNFYLHPYSVVEYNGMNNQIVTGIGNGIATTNNHKYGILKINFTGDANSEFVFPNMSNVYVRTRLDLENGEFNLNGTTVTIESGSTDAINRLNGYIKSEIDNADNTSILKWENLTSGDHEFPFGSSSAEYMPITFTPTAGMGGTASISTRSTIVDNTPLPQSVLQDLATVNPNLNGLSSTQDSSHIIVNGIDIAQDEVLDRWWQISAPGVTANVTLSYRGEENTLAASKANSTMGLITWDGSTWNKRPISGLGTTTGIGTVTINNVSTFGPWAIISYISALPIELVSFKASIADSEVNLNWTTATEVNNDHFSIERSRDGREFEVIGNVKGAGNSSGTKNYAFIDQHPYTGTSYYRLKQIDYDKKFAYSQIETVKFNSGVNSNPFVVDNIFPSPFTDHFTLTYKVADNSETMVTISNSSGQLVHQEKQQSTEGMNKFEFKDNYGLQNGIYYITLINGDQKISQKIIKN